MNSSAINIVTIWGLWFWAIFILILVLRWCHDVNQKLDYILERLGKMDKKDASSAQAKQNMNAAVHKPVSPWIAICIIGAAILLLFLIPVWWINR